MPVVGCVVCGDAAVEETGPAPLCERHLKEATDNPDHRFRLKRTRPDTEALADYITTETGYDAGADYHVYVLDLRRSDGRGTDRYVGMSGSVLRRLKSHLRDGGKFMSYIEEGGELVCGEARYETLSVMEVTPVYGSQKRAEWVERREYMNHARRHPGAILGGR